MRLIKIEDYSCYMAIDPGDMNGGFKTFIVPYSEGVDIIELQLNYSSTDYSDKVEGFIELYTVDSGVLSKYKLYLKGSSDVNNTKNIYFPVVGNKITLEYEHEIENFLASEVECYVHLSVKFWRSN